jgi:hypothetical protein
VTVGSQESGSRARSLIGGALGGALAGGLLVLAFRDGGPPPPSAAPQGPSDGAKVDSADIAALAGELRRLRELLEQQRGLAPPLERAVAPSGSDEALERTLQELVAVLQSRSVPASGGPSPAAALLELSARAAPLHDRVWEFPDEFEGDGPLSRQHRFWSYERVLASYGAPDDAKVEGGTLKWIFQDEAKQRRVVFEFYDGFVVRCLAESW